MATGNVYASTKETPSKNTPTTSEPSSGTLGEDLDWDDTRYVLAMKTASFDPVQLLLVYKIWGFENFPRRIKAGTTRARRLKLEINPRKCPTINHWTGLRRLEFCRTLQHLFPECLEAFRLCSEMKPAAFSIQCIHVSNECNTCRLWRQIHLLAAIEVVIDFPASFSRLWSLLSGCNAPVWRNPVRDSNTTVIIFGFQAGIQFSFLILLIEGKVSVLNLNNQSNPIPSVNNRRPKRNAT